MNKYQEALNNYSENVDYRDYSTKIVDIVNESYDTLQELVDQTKTSTLEEVKKEWEELGYEWRIPKEYPHMIWLVDDEEEEKWVLRIKINTQSKKYLKLWGDGGFERFTFQEHNLLTRTFKALGWYDE